jgi:hypothetical protein
VLELAVGIFAVVVDVGMYSALEPYTGEYFRRNFSFDPAFLLYCGAPLGCFA